MQRPLVISWIRHKFFFPAKSKPAKADDGSMLTPLQEGGSRAQPKSPPTKRKTRGTVEPGNASTPVQKAAPVQESSGCFILADSAYRTDSQRLDLLRVVSADQSAAAASSAPPAFSQRLSMFKNCEACKTMPERIDRQGKKAKRCVACEERRDLNTTNKFLRAQNAQLRSIIESQYACIKEQSALISDEYATSGSEIEDVD